MGCHAVGILVIHHPASVLESDGDKDVLVGVHMPPLNVQQSLCKSGCWRQTGSLLDPLSGLSIELHSVTDQICRVLAGH